MPAGVPAMLTPFTIAWGEMCAYNAEILCGPDEYVHRTWTQKSFHSAARNELVGEMRGDWLLMVDTDHWFEPDLTARMLDRLNTFEVDVVCGVYTFKTPPYLPVLYQFNENTGLGRVIGDWNATGEGVLGNELVQVDAAGAGCLMVRASVYDRVFAELGEKPFDSVRHLGEDMSFFERLKRLGIKSYFDPRIECHHLEVRRTSLADCNRAAYIVGQPRPGMAIKPVDALERGAVA
jgi:hypothetical protein